MSEPRRSTLQLGNLFNPFGRGCAAPPSRPEPFIPNGAGFTPSAPTRPVARVRKWARAWLKEEDGERYAARTGVRRTPLGGAPGWPGWLHTPARRPPRRVRPGDGLRQERQVDHGRGAGRLQGQRVLQHRRRRAGRDRGRAGGRGSLAAAQHGPGSPGRLRRGRRRRVPAVRGGPLPPADRGGRPVRGRAGRRLLGTGRPPAAAGQVGGARRPGQGARDGIRRAGRPEDDRQEVTAWKCAPPGIIPDFGKLSLSDSSHLTAVAPAGKLEPELLNLTLN